MISNETIKVIDTVIQGNGNIVSDMGEEKVMLSVSKGKYYNLGEIGGYIWDLIAKPLEVNKIIEELTSLYEVESDVCEEQVISFLEHLLREELIVIK
ncbi:lasso peptide biosynthesis PqqD family chaperone [Litchfieldia alkalitelluris]|uniref:lasso peptide biosynthesis PqqD family chaperone n=1 Tax=Litchfieldia alkalitelluris TaxID=304268 RepID=UPI000997EFD4|nr:lasso peptide biosynthesis PqqD family chaperone [Litchfieldia alkalitelluris]